MTNDNPEYYLAEAQYIGDDYNNRMLALANKFKREVIIPLCKRHGLTRFIVDDVVFNGDYSFSAPDGVKYVRAGDGGVYKYPLTSSRLEVTRKIPEQLRNDLEDAFRVLHNIRFKEFLTSVNVTLDRG